MRTTIVAISIILCALSVSAFTCNGGTGPQPTPGPKPTSTPAETAAPTTTSEPQPQPTATATTVMGGVPDVRIIRIYYKGDEECNECNEYVVIKNYEDSSLNLIGWELVDITDGYPTFTFPHFILDRGKLARIYTNDIQPPWETLTFESEEAIWNNTHPDMAALYNSRGELVSNKSYEIY